MHIARVCRVLRPRDSTRGHPPALPAPEIDSDLVAIPGAESTLGIGNPSRALVLSAAEDFHGAHTGTRAYFDRPNEPLAKCGRVLRLKTVCWLAVGGPLNDVPAGNYECIVRCRLTTPQPNFDGDWKVGVGVRHSRGFDRSKVDDVGPLHLRHLKADGKGGAFLKSLPSSKFSALSFGVLQLDAPSPVRFEMGGGSPYWCSGIEFDALELRKVGPHWQVVRVLLLGADADKQPGTDPERPGCQLARLPLEVLRMVVGLL